MPAGRGVQRDERRGLPLGKEPRGCGNGCRMKRVAIVMLACRDYEAMELSLACHTAYLPEGTRLFILQNCRGSYDAERTLAVARRYELLFPLAITVVDEIPPGAPYHSIAALLASPRFAEIDLICKVDDDAFPIASGWLDGLIDCWKEASAQSNRPLAYVTPLINNNTWGFPQTLDAMGLRQAYLADAAREHRIGADTPEAPVRIVPASEIHAGTCGTIWAYPYVARWLHARTTLEPDRFIAATRDLSNVEVPNQERYSIGCILFRKELWPRIDDGGSDDEHMLHQYCKRTNGRIICARSVPFVHLAYFTQREENRDIVEMARKVYEPRLGHPFPIALRASRLLEIEARLRWMDGERNDGAQLLPANNGRLPGGLTAEALGLLVARGIYRAVLSKLKLVRPTR